MKTVEDVANGGGPCDRYVSRSGIALASRLRTWRKSLIEPWPRQLDRENSTGEERRMAGTANCTRSSRPGRRRERRERVSRYAGHARAAFTKIMINDGQVRIGVGSI